MTKALLCLPSVSYSVVKERLRLPPPAPPSSEEPHGAKIYRRSGGFAAGPLSNLVEIAGLEPAASGLQSRRSPS
jgi:hypothetical protein